MTKYNEDRIVNRAVIQWLDIHKHVRPVIVRQISYMFLKLMDKITEIVDSDDEIELMYMQKGEDRYVRTKESVSQLSIWYENSHHRT